MFGFHLSYSPLSGWMCQLCAVDRAVEPHPPLHLWNRSVPTHLHIHQQRLEGRGEQDDYRSLRGIYSKTPPALSSLNISQLPPGALICLWFPMLPCDVLVVYFHAYWLSNLPLQDYLFRLVPGYVDSGKGKCSYDPKQENVAVLISKTWLIYSQKKTQ